MSICSLLITDLTIQCHAFRVKFGVISTLTIKSQNGKGAEDKDMSQQAAAGQGAGHAGGRKTHYFPRGGGGKLAAAKAFKSLVPGIKEYTFNTGHNKFAAQFTQSRENVVNFLQQTANNKGYLVAETVRSGRVQTIELPPPLTKITQTWTI